MTASEYFLNFADNSSDGVLFGDTISSSTTFLSLEFQFGHPIALLPVSSYQFLLLGCRCFFGPASIGREPPLASSKLLTLLICLDLLTLAYL